MPERRQHHGDDARFDQDKYRERHSTTHHYEKSRNTGRNQEERGGGSASDRGFRHDRHQERPASKRHHALSTLPKEMPVNQPEEVYYERDHRSTLFTLRYIPTSRGLCQLMEIFVNLLIIICAGIPYSNNGGYRDLASLGGVYAYHFGGANAFTGADADRVKELDRLFHQLKKPPYIFTMAYAGCVMVYACIMLCLGVFKVPYRLPLVLLVETILNFLIGLAYIPALAFYFIKLQETYNNAICKEREQMYKSKGHKGFECQFHGADIAGGLFGVVGIFVFIFSAVLAIRAFRTVKDIKSQQRNEENNY